MIFDIGDALLSLRPGAQFVIRGGVIEFYQHDDPQPTAAEIEAEITRLQSEYEAKEYQRQRQPEYPSLAELADAMYWSSKGDNTKLEEYYAACEAVKAKYPKPTGGAE